MEPNAFPQLQLWCPRPFGTYSQNKPCPGPGSTKKPFSCRPTEEPAGAQAPSENTPPAPAYAAPASPTSVEEGRVLLDTWYVIKPGNTKEKVAFFVAHQCGSGSGGSSTGGRASTMKVKGNWGSDSSKAKRRRRCHDPTKSKPSPAWATGSKDTACLCPSEPSAAASEAPDLLSVAEMVALVEQRTAETKVPSGSDCSRVAEAVARFESRQQEHGAPGPGEVRIDSAKKMKEETVRLPAAAQEDPLPGQLFLLPVPEETPVVEDMEASEEPSAVPDPSLCRLYRHVSHDFLEIRFKIQRLLEPRQYMLLLPEHVMVKIFSYLPTQALAALKCSCHYFKSIIETFGVQATDSRWNRDPLYRDDPCKQCKKHYEKGDVSLCRWHPKPYHHDLPYGRSYWMCCRRPDKEAPGCRVGLHDNNWVHPATRHDDGR
uniref:F-box protein 46 n=1 Tax=Buteo japonicus TaxID=224669 RepID=A0A8B9Z3P1_9AVES